MSSVRISLWDYAYTLRTSPVQDEVAPLWKVLTHPVRVGQNTDMFVRNKASIGLCVHVCICMHV